MTGKEGLDSVDPVNPDPPRKQLVGFKWSEVATLVTIEGYW